MVRQSKNSFMDSASRLIQALVGWSSIHFLRAQIQLWASNQLILKGRWVLPICVQNIGACWFLRRAPLPRVRVTFLSRPPWQGVVSISVGRHSNECNGTFLTAFPHGMMALHKVGWDGNPVQVFKQFREGPWRVLGRNHSIPSWKSFTSLLAWLNPMVGIEYLDKDRWEIVCITPHLHPHKHYFPQ